VPPLEIVVGVRESLMLLVNSHIFKMAAMLKPNAKYNRRVAIIEGFRAGRLATEIIRFFGYPRSIVYNVMTKYTALEQSNKVYQRERVTRKNAPRGLPQALISDPGQSLRKLTLIVGVSEPKIRRIAEEPSI